MEERIGAMRAIWTQEEASYYGEFVDFDRIWSWPKPARRPHPPVLVGGNGATVLERMDGEPRLGFTKARPAASREPLP